MRGILTMAGSILISTGAFAAGALERGSYRSEAPLCGFNVENNGDDYVAEFANNHRYPCQLAGQVEEFTWSANATYEAILSSNEKMIWEILSSKSFLSYKLSQQPDASWVKSDMSLFRKEP